MDGDKKDIDTQRREFEERLVLDGFAVPKEKVRDAETGVVDYGGVEDIARAENILRKKNGPEAARGLSNVEILQRGFQESLAENIQLHDEAGEDPLTGALTRRRYEKNVAVLNEERAGKIRRTKGEGGGKRATEITEHEREPFAIIDFDVDHFKDINDTYGHPAGDKVLKEICRRIQGRIRKGDMLVRTGGEEFRVVLLAANGHVGMVAEQIRRIIEGEPFDVGGGHKINVTISLGVSPYDESLEVMQGRADGALYKAKRGGRNQVWLWDKKTGGLAKYSADDDVEVRQIAA